MIDTHQHFWRYDPVRYDWIDESMAEIRRDFLPEDLEPELEKHGLQGCIAVQADQTEEETLFLLDLALQHPFIQGVVGWVDLRAPTIFERLDHFASFDRLRGFRHIVQGETDVNFMLRPDFLRGIEALQKHNFTYDILVYPHQLGAALELIRRFPEQPFVIDHIAKPYIREAFFDGWAVMMGAIASHPNAFCKVSGMVTEAHWPGWKYEDFVPYLDVVFDAFGVEGIMYGSDWPVCLVAGTYTQVIDILQRYTDRFSKEEKAAVFGGNGRAFYGM
jgi:L-fuconolactonase